jgi:hypothetical protein
LCNFSYLKRIIIRNINNLGEFKKGVLVPKCLSNVFWAQGEKDLSMRFWVSNSLSIAD